MNTTPQFMLDDFSAVTKDVNDGSMTAIVNGEERSFFAQTIENVPLYDIGGVDVTRCRINIVLEAGKLWGIGQRVKIDDIEWTVEALIRSGLMTEAIINNFESGGLSL